MELRALIMEKDTLAYVQMGKFKMHLTISHSLIK